VSAVYLVDLPLRNDPSRVWGEAASCVIRWIDARIGIPVLANDHSVSEDGLARVEHYERSGEAGRLSRWDTFLVRQGWNWHTSLWLYDDDGSVTLRVRLQVSAHGERVTELNRPLFAPGVVGDVLGRLNVVADGFVLGQAMRLGPDDVGGLIAYLRDPLRAKPVVVVTSRAGSAHGPGPADAMTHRLGGLAHVVDLDDTGATRLLTAAVTDQLSVFDGGIRLYWPGFTTEDRRTAHPLYLRRTIEQSGRDSVEKTVFRRIADASVLVPNVPALDRLLQEEAAASERARTDSLLSAFRTQLQQRPGPLADGQTLVGPEWFDDYEKALQAAERAQKERDEAVFEVDLLAEELDRLNADLAVARQNWRAMSTLDQEPGEDPEGDSEDEGPAPRSVLEAVRRAEVECSQLVFLEEAFTSAGQSFFPRPQKVLDDLRGLNKSVARWRSGRDNLPLRRLFEEEGITNLRPGISKTALTQFGTDYARTYKGEMVYLRSHLATGVGAPSTILRIYWYEDGEDRTLVIGHVGRKLRDNSNR
jgi:hypothetical protein